VDRLPKNGFGVEKKDSKSWEGGAIPEEVNTRVEKLRKLKKRAVPLLRTENRGVTPKGIKRRVSKTCLRRKGGKLEEQEEATDLHRQKEHRLLLTRDETPIQTRGLNTEKKKDPR